MDWKKLFFSFEGRIRRQDFWVAWLVIFGLSMISNFIPFIGPIIGLALIYPSVCIYSTRLHDFGKTGWLQLIPYGVFLVCMVVGIAMFGGALMAAGMAAQSAGGGGNPFAILGSLGGFAGLLGVGVIVNILFLIWVGATPGDPETNRYGRPPGLLQDAEETFG